MDQEELNSIHSDKDYLKLKLYNILHYEHFCGICTEIENNMSLVNEEVEIIADCWTESATLMDVFEEVFNNAENILLSSNLCNNCMEKLIQSYIFIHSTRKSAKTLTNYTDELCFKSIDLNKHSLKPSASTISNVAIVLNTDYCFNGITINDDKKEINNEDLENKKEIPRRVIKKRVSDTKTVYKCLACNIILPSYLVWRKHEIEYHSNKTLQCEECLKTFKTEQYLTAHYKVHSKVKCRICHRIICEEELTEHLKGIHKDKAHFCSVCNCAYYSANALMTHQRIYHENSKAGQCIMCLKNFSAEELKSHSCKFNCPECFQMPCIHYKYLLSYREQILNHMSKTKCLDCDYVCRKKEILLGHVNREHLDHHPYSCDKCGQQFYSKPILKAHIYRFHQDFYCCTFCDSEFSRQTAWETHKNECEKILRQYLCDQCSASFDSTEQLTEHNRRRHTTIFPCHMCNKTFLKESKRKEHVVKVHKGIQIKNRVSIVECPVCEQKYDTKGQLIHHVKSHGPSIKFPCRICNVEYDTIRKLKAHNRKHVGPFSTCHICGKFMRSVFLEKHISSHNNAAVTCESCGRSFQNSTLLKQHHKQHLDSIPCPKCGKLINPAKLRRHWKGHMMEDNPVLKERQKQKPNVKCDLCDYTTWNNILLDCHMNRHHLKIKPYVCHICSKDFIGKHLLNKHIETHSNKNISCMICGKRFANSACLKMHLRLHTGETPYSCDVCGAKFRSSSIMNVHKIKKHSDRSSGCPLCSSQFHTVRELRRHVIKVHWKQKNKKFNPRELKGLEEHYHLFHDGRRVKVNEGDVDFFMPCEEVKLS